jgi:hypothetical protein
VIHGMQEARGSSPLSSTPVQRYISNTEPVTDAALRGIRGASLPFRLLADQRKPDRCDICFAVHGLDDVQEVTEP